MHPKGSMTWSTCPLLVGRDTKLGDCDYGQEVVWRFQHGRRRLRNHGRTEGRVSAVTSGPTSISRHSTELNGDHSDDFTIFTPCKYVIYELPNTDCVRVPPGPKLAWGRLHDAVSLRPLLNR